MDREMELWRRREPEAGHIESPVGQALDERRLELRRAQPSIPRDGDPGAPLGARGGCVGKTERNSVGGTELLADDAAQIISSDDCGIDRVAWSAHPVQTA